MKIEQLIVQYLYKNKEVTLQGIGKFKLSPDVAIPEDNEKEFAMPQNAILFEYNIKSIEDTGLIDYIVQQTRKIKPLATSDLDSYIILSKQFLNIGKPLWVEGLGTLLKTQQGNYEFMPAGFISPKMEGDNTPLKEKSEEEISFRTQPQTVKNKKNILYVIVFIGILILALVLWFLFYKKNTPVDNNSTTTQNVTDTLAKNSAAISRKDTSAKFTFKVVLKEYPDYSSASKYFNKLSSYGHNLILYTKDSAVYKVAMPFTNSLNDTIVIKDSLKRFLFGGNPYIEI